MTGKKMSMSGGGESCTYTYDSLGRLLSETQTGNILKEYRYDAANNLKQSRILHNGIEISNTGYTYDNLNRMAHVYEKGELKATYTYDSNGNRQSLTYANGISIQYEYNLANKLIILTNKQGATTISSYSYTYFSDGNQEKKIDWTGKTTTYGYDGLGRLISEEATGGETILYAYYDSSNRMSMTAGEKTTIYAYDRNNRLITETTGENTITYAYDGNGNQIAKETGGEITINKYDGFNRLKKQIQGSNNAEYEYNGDGLRTKKTVNAEETRQIWIGKQIVCELDAADVAKAVFIRGINLIYAEMEGLQTYYVYNGHGDVVQLIDESGTLTKTYEYDAFGVEKDADEEDINPFRYCGEYFDKETGTYYLRARYYNPAIGRFITEDSYPGDPRDPLSLNLYIYAYNNPIMYTDPTGHAPEWVNSILNFFGIGPKIHVGSETIHVNVDVGYRYVSEAEYQFIKQNGYIPNTDINGNPKDVYVSTNKYNGISDAESGLQIGAKNPNGATQSPKYRVEFKLNSVKYNYMGNVQGGTGVELTTKEKIIVDTKKNNTAQK